MLVYEEGPFDIFVVLRNTVGVKYDSMANAYGINVIAKLFSCIWCLSFWVGAVLTILYVFMGDIAIVLCLPFAISAVAIIIHTKTEQY